MKIKLYNSDEMNFVEFSFSSGHQGFEPTTSRSKYVHSAVFCLFQYAFELSKPDFRYYRATAYGSPDIVKLRNHLVDQLSRIMRIVSAEALETYVLKQVEGIDFLNELKTENPNWRISWENIRDQLKQVLDELLEMVDFCIDEDKIFWVKGY
jgi:hypothetical protein